MLGGGDKRGATRDAPTHPKAAAYLKSPGEGLHGSRFLCLQGEGSHGDVAAPRGPPGPPVRPQGRRSLELRARKGRRGAKASREASRCPLPPVAREGRRFSRAGSSACLRLRLSFLPQASVSSSSLPVRPEGGECVLRACRAVRLAGGPSVHPRCCHPRPTARRLAELGS
ncbi:hypothetical protein NDU88_003949 [Pleurodeles waltl]|uniref:Uncharacterized protein n=1 Tax=Pleurodeles waltl TaxID=8319 RepID=A0AAV7MX39_PLEWA|nr:hypothetical protein NDU88_003949 [Pleurodeles waltl]